jgi:HEAT repeat protein
VASYGEQDIVERAEAELASQLRAAPAAQLEQILEATGNAGCTRCVPVLRASLGSRSIGVRLAASGALRFVVAPAATPLMCGVLESDDSPNVREQAAWALRWRYEDAVTRVNCLVRAAARDSSRIVRVTAVNSLATLAKDVPRSRSALLELTDTEYDSDVRSIALRTVGALPPVPVREDGRGD